MSCDPAQTIEMLRGDSATLAITTNRDLSACTSVIFTAKHNIADADEDAIFQKFLGAGVTVFNATNATVVTVPQDTLDVTRTQNVYFDLQGQFSDGTVVTGAIGILTIRADVTRSTTTSVPVVTTNPPAPTAGGPMSDLTPEPLGVAAAGTSVEASRADHVHAMPTAADVGAQPLDAELTAIAALTTQPYGRSVLETANAAALRTLSDSAAADLSEAAQQTALSPINTLSDRSGYALATAERARSAALMAVAREDAPAFVEDWSDIASWAQNGTGLQVTGGRLYSTGAGAGNSNANYGIGLALDGTARAATVINIVSSSLGGGVMFGFSSAAEGAAPSSAGGNTKGIYLRSIASVAQSVTNGAFANIATSNLAAGDYNTLAWADADYLSVVAIRSDLATTLRTRFARAAGDANNVTVFNSSAGALSGQSIGPVGIRESVATIAPRDGIEGRVFGVFSGDGTNNFRVTTPANYDSRVPCPVAILCHGNGSDITHFDDNTNGKSARNAFLNAGFITVAGAAPNTTTWGAQAGLDAYVAAYRYVRDHFNVGAVVLYGNSMGGLESLLLAAGREIPGVVAWCASVPAWDLAAAYAGSGGGTSFIGAINAAYDIPGGGTYEEQTAGHDPALMSPANWAGLPMYMIDATDDSVLPVALHADALEDALSSYSADFVRVSITGGHSSASIASSVAAMAAWALTKAIR